MKRALAVAIALVGIAAMPATAGAADAAKKGKGKGHRTLTVCKFGCKYRTIQKAVNKSGRNATIRVRPGTYREGVVVKGHKHDGLTIKGAKKNPKKVVLQGKNAKSPDGLAQNGIQGTNVRRLTLKNMWARNYATNGFYVEDSNPGPGKKVDCSNFLMKNLLASFNRSYGLYAYGCKGGRITKSEGWGHGDSAFYIGGTPVQKNPRTTRLDHLDAHKNVLGYSGTNSHYVKITKSDWYNNGIGLVPNTLDSEPFEPTSDGVIKNNDIFWNNFNYYLPNSGVQTVSEGLGEVGGLTLNYPTGIGVALFGATGWKIKNNEIFGHFKWGSALFSDPFNCEGPPGPDCPTGDDAMSQENRFVNNSNGRGGTDVNAVDFWNDGSGMGNCFSGNESSTNDGATPDHTEAFLYPGCPAPDSAGTHSPNGDTYQVFELVDYTTSDPPETMQCSWSEHPHPKFKKFKPLEVTPGPDCP